MLLYDLTSTYFEADASPAPPDGDLKRFGYSRDKRPACEQVVIALIVTPEGFPLAYEVLPGHTSDRTTLHAFLKKIEAQYGKAERIWVMDRGIPTEEVLAEMRASDPPVYFSRPPTDPRYSPPPPRWSALRKAGSKSRKPTCSASRGNKCARAWM